MNEEFVSFEIAKKLKEKGFECDHPFAMYNEKGVFHDLCTSAQYMISASGFECRCYYDYEDFDEHDCVAPTISQVLKWLREEKKIHCLPHFDQGIDKWLFYIANPNAGCEFVEFISGSIYDTYEQAALAGIEYAIDNLL